MNFNKSMTNISLTIATSNAYDWTDEHSDFTKGFFLCTAILAFVGNFLVLFLFLHNRKWLKKAYGRFILELALVDVLASTCLFAIPFIIHTKTRMSSPSNHFAREIYCKLLWSHYILFSLGVTSVYTCLVLTTERWIAVVKPFRINTNTPSKKSLITSLALPWLAGFTLASNVAMETIVSRHGNGTYECEWNIERSVGTSGSSVLSVISFVGAILLPAVFIVYMYAHILYKLQRGNTSKHDIQRPHPKSRAFYKLAFKRTTKMAACATIAVVICWLPCQVYTLLAHLGYTEFETTLHRMLNLLAFLNCCLNPFIYAFSNAAYRKKFLQMFTKLICIKTPSPMNTDNAPSVFV